MACGCGVMNIFAKNVDFSLLTYSCNQSQAHYLLHYFFIISPICHRAIVKEKKAKIDLFLQLANKIFFKLLYAVNFT